jgi:hypothetical protein
LQNDFNNKITIFLIIIWQTSKLTINAENHFCDHFDFQLFP